MRRSFEERLNIVSQAKAGKPIRKLSREHGLHKDKILEWVRKYDRYGEDGLKKQPNVHVSGEFKEVLVRQIIEKGIPLAHVLVESRVSRSALELWVRETRKNGYQILYQNQKRGRPPKDTMSRPKKTEPQTELEKLQAENLRLRAENALLKKVKALVKEKNARVRLNGQEPLTN